MKSKKKKQKTIANSIMIGIIAAIVVAAVLGVGFIRGWFGDKGADTAVLADV